MFVFCISADKSTKKYAFHEIFRKKVCAIRKNSLPLHPQSKESNLLQ